MYLSFYFTLVSKVSGQSFEACKFVFFSSMYYQQGPYRPEINNENTLWGEVRVSEKLQAALVPSVVRSLAETRKRWESKSNELNSKMLKFTNFPQKLPFWTLSGIPDICKFFSTGTPQEVFGLHFHTYLSSRANLKGDQGGKTPRWSQLQILPTLHFSLIQWFFKISFATPVMNACHKKLVYKVLCLSCKPVWVGFWGSIKSLLYKTNSASMLKYTLKKS